LNAWSFPWNLKVEQRVSCDLAADVLNTGEKQTIRCITMKNWSVDPGSRSFSFKFKLDGSDLDESN